MSGSADGLYGVLYDADIKVRIGGTIDSQPKHAYLTEQGSSCLLLQPVLFSSGGGSQKSSVEIQLPHFF